MFRYLRAHYEPTWRFVSRQYLYACLLDLQSLKPGNVGLHGEGHGKTCRDFRQSAQASAELVTRPNWTLGKRVWQAAQATWEVVGCNTNIGILLLVAPMVEAYYRCAEEKWSKCLPQVLEATTVTDARDVYRAIRLMQPVGLGQVEKADIQDAPRISLRAAMELASSRDRIAAEYCNGFELVLNQAQPQWENLCQRWKDPRWAMVGTFLHMLAHYPDSHVARVHGAATADAISGKIKSLADKFCDAKVPQTYQSRLLELDALWKSSGISPGTTADLTLAGVFAARLAGWSDDRDSDVLTSGSDSRI